MTDANKEAVVRGIMQLMGEKNVQVEADIPQGAHGDWSQERGGKPLLRVTPRTTQEVSEIMAICHQYGCPVVPQGGLTGLAGGAVPSTDCVLLSLARMDGIEDVDTQSSLMTVQAGATLQSLQDEAQRHGMMFALDLGARGSCQIGGNIATNAGGNRVIRYGMTRDLVLGLEVVLADGSILPMMNRMKKNNAALNLNPLFIGSEGTLGIITRAVLKLDPGVAGANTALVALNDFEAGLKLLNFTQKQTSSRISAFEMLWNDYYREAVQCENVRCPLDTTWPIYVLMDMQGADPEHDRALFESVLEHAFDSGWVQDAVITHSARENAELWDVRDAIAQLLAAYSPSIAFDVSIPMADIGRCVDAMQASFDEHYPDIKSMHFGHAGDSNIHIVVGPADEQQESDIEARIYAIVRDFDGSVSAEHGIGLHKKRWLHYSKSKAEISLIKSLKEMIDPKGILNPGKVI